MSLEKSKAILQVHHRLAIEIKSDDCFNERNTLSLFSSFVQLSQLKKMKEKEEHTSRRQKPNTSYRSHQSLSQLNLLLSIKVVELRINIKSKIMKDTRGTKIPVRGTRRATRDSLPCSQSGTPRMEAVVLHWTCPGMMKTGLHQ